MRHTFPLDGEYVIRPRLARDVNESVPVYLEPQMLEVSLDGARIELLTVPGAVPAPARGAALASGRAAGCAGADVGARQDAARFCRARDHPD